MESSSYLRHPLTRGFLATSVTVVGLIFPIDYLTSPLPWHELFHWPVFASLMAGVAMLAFAVAGATIWFGPVRLAAAKPDEIFPGEHHYASLMRDGDVLEIRGAMAGTTAEDIARSFPTASMPVPMLLDQDALAASHLLQHASVTAVDVSEGDVTQSLVSTLFAFFGNTPDATLAFALQTDATPPVASPTFSALFTTRGDRVDDFVRPQLSIDRGDAQEIERMLRRFATEANRRSLGFSRCNPTNGEASPRGALSRSQWNDVIEAFKSHIKKDTDIPIRPFLPAPWSSKQLSYFDASPVLAYLHRPVAIDALCASLIQALRHAYILATKSLPRSLLPTRLVYDSGAHPSWGGTIVEALVMRPELTADFLGQGGIHDVRQLPDRSGVVTGAKLIVGAVLLAQRDGCTAAVVHRIDDERAEIVIISSSAGAGRDTEAPLIHAC